MASGRAMWKLAAGAIAALVAASCLEPTQVRILITTDAVCSDLDEVQITVGPPEKLKEGLVAAATRVCEDGRVGDLVFSPGSGSTHSLNFQVVVGVGKPTSACAGSNYLGGCIVARRALSYVPRRSLTLPIELELDCVDVPCSATQTCRSGSCVSSEIGDPSLCAEPGGCDGLGGFGGAASGGSESGGTTGGGSGGTDPSGGAPATGGEPPILRNPSTAHALTVTTALDGIDGDTASIDALLADPGTDGLISLREAILAANSSINDSSPDRIDFGIGSGGVPSILVEAPGLPVVRDPVILDASTEAGGSVELDGTNAGASHGLALGLGSDGSVVRNFVVNRFEKAGIFLRDSGSHSVFGCRLGVDAGATVALPNGTGLFLSNSAKNAIGAPSGAGEGTNIFSGNTGAGLSILGGGSTENLVLGSLVGLNGLANARLGNGIGIVLGAGASDNRIGNAVPLDRNIVSANAGEGILVTGSETQRNVVIGAFVGSDSAFSALATLGNGVGIRVADQASGTILGSEDFNIGNRVAYNIGAGIVIEATAARTAVLGNITSSNGGPGIDLLGDGVTLNRPTNAMTNPNALPNFPIAESASYAGSDVTVNFSLDATPGTYRVEFFSIVSPADPSGYGEGFFRESFLTINHPMRGLASYSTTFACASTTILTATATRVLGTEKYGTTSEFSLNFPTTYTKP